MSLVTSVASVEKQSDSANMKEGKELDMQTTNSF